MPYTFNPLSETFDFYKNPTPGGTSGQVQFNNSGVLGGVSTTAVDGSGNLTFSGRWIQSTNGASNAAPYILTGTWFSGGDSTTTKPQLLIEPTGTTSNTWSTAGTGFGVNAPSGFTGNLATFGINGTERMRITASGNVGIGTTTPGVLLEVNGAMTAQGNIFAASGGATRTITLGPAGAGLEYNTDGTTYLGGRTDAYPLVFRTNSAERLRITSGGNIGIGTAAPGTKLDIAGGLRVVADQNTTGISSNILLDGSPNAISTLLFRQNAGDTQRGFVRINATAANNVQMEFGTANTLRMVIGGNALNGNVGIGTASPLAKLEVKGSTLISTTNNGNNILGFNDVAFAGGTLNGAPDGASGSAFIVGNGSTSSGAPSYLSMWTTNGGVVSERMRINSVGNVGIGTANPAALLDVNGTSVFRTTSTFRDHSPELVSATAQGWRTTIYQSGIGGGGQNTFQRADGTEATPTNVKNGMSIGSLSFRGHNGSGFTGSKGFISVSASQDWTATANGTNISFDTTESNTTTLQNRMFIRHDGNIGIGTANPLSKLVISNAGAQGFEFDPSTGIFQVYNRSTSAYGELRPYGSIIRFFTGTSPSERMRLDSSGNLGIGTASPTVKLEVNGQIRTEAPTGGTAANWRLGTVHAVTPTSPNRTIEVDIGGTIYYLHAKTTND